MTFLSFHLLYRIVFIVSNAIFRIVFIDPRETENCLSLKMIWTIYRLPQELDGDGCCPAQCLDQCSHIQSVHFKSLFGMAAMPFLCRDHFLPKYHTIEM